MNTLELLQGDFKLFLQALWAQLDLPSQLVLNMLSQTIFNMDLSVFRFKLSVELVSRGSLERSFSGLSLTIRSERL